MWRCNPRPTADDDFSQRVYTYNYRLFDRYNRKVVSLAVLAGPPENAGNSEKPGRPPRLEAAVKQKGYTDKISVNPTFGNFSALLTGSWTCRTIWLPAIGGSTGPSK